MRPWFAKATHVIQQKSSVVPSCACRIIEATVVQQSPGHAIITGATQGIGLEAARELARLGYRLTLVARDPDSLGRVAAGINAVAGAGVVTTRVADLSLLRQVKRLGEEILAAGEPIQALVHNAGAYFNPRRVTGEGVETTWALNHLAVFGLTRLLEPLLLASAPARVLVVSSNAHNMVRDLPLDDLEYSRNYRALQAYGRSKLANILFVREQARQWSEASGLTINAVHPGVVRTRFFRGNGLMGWFWRTLLNRVAITPAAGARGLVQLAADSALQGVTGKYFNQMTEKEPSALAQNADLAQRLWEASARRWVEVTGG